MRITEKSKEFKAILDRILSALKRVIKRKLRENLWVRISSLHLLGFIKNSMKLLRGFGEKGVWTDSEEIIIYEQGFHKKTPILKETFKIFSKKLLTKRKKI